LTDQLAGDICFANLGIGSCNEDITSHYQITFEIPSALCYIEYITIYKGGSQSWIRIFLTFSAAPTRHYWKAKARHAEFKNGDVILKQGDSNASLYIIKSGDVSVVTRMLEHTFEIDQLHAGDLFGDMSFVDTDSISTDIVAVGDVAIEIVTDEDVDAIIKDDPMFYGRFYHALAQLLSYRLRKKNAQLEGSAFGGD